ncbi:MAG: Pr6Pr family membrane protein [Spirochaetia bacterium]|nr:Pr6Pr family membrane protein [Spirochaetia bacterium]
MIQGKKIFRPIAFAVSAACIVLTMIDCPRHKELFSYFTIQSNVMCLIVLLWNLKKEPPALLRGLATVCITLTFLVYHFMLRPADLTLYNLWNIKNMATAFAHYLVPAFVWTDYLFFAPKGNMRVSYPLKWLCYPLLYLAYIKLIYKPLGGTFIVDGQVCSVPYFFLDAEALGIMGMTVWCVAIAAVIMILSYLFLLLDRLLSR